MPENKGCMTTSLTWSTAQMLLLSLTTQTPLAPNVRVSGVQCHTSSKTVIRLACCLTSQPSCSAPVPAPELRGAIARCTYTTDRVGQCLLTDSLTHSLRWRPRCCLPKRQVAGCQAVLPAFRVLCPAAAAAQGPGSAADTRSRPPRVAQTAAMSQSAAAAAGGGAASSASSGRSGCSTEQGL